MKTSGLVIAMHERGIDDTCVESSYASATRFLHENYSYIFEGHEGSTESLLINTWSKQARQSEVLKHGTLQDIANLAPANPKNKPRHCYVRLPRVRIKKEGSLAMVCQRGNGR